VPTVSKSSSHSAEVLARCKTLASFSEDDDGTRRTFLSPPMRDCHRQIADWLRPLEVEVRIDAAGNLRGLYAGTMSSAPRLMIGSHLDTVPNAGAYDGILGVALAIALLEGLEGKRLPFAIEIVGFSEEEGVRFGIPFIGSRALVGRLDNELLDRKDADHVSLRTAIQHFGLSVSEIPQARMKEDVLGYLEFHIEQGPLLEHLNLPLGVVETIAGQSRLECKFTGQTNHAGTTPMHLRRDAIAGAAEWITAVEKTAQSRPGLVATVGAIDAKPGVTNAIAGKTRVSLDVRHASDEIRRSAVEELIDCAEEIARRRELQVKWKTLLDQSAVAMTPRLTDQIAKAMRATGSEPHRMVSGAGHDAMIMAERVPAAMIFLRTPGGISHHPSESVLVEDVGKAIECGLHLLDQLSNSDEFLKGTYRA
jgi:allantoate deiminase